MKISDLSFVADEPTTKTLTIGDAEYQVGIREISFADMEESRGSSVALISRAVVFEGGQTLSVEQAGKLDAAVAVKLSGLINEVNSPKP